VSIVPPARPEMSRDDVVALASALGLTAKTFMLGRRGYYRDTMGKPGENDIGLYDDAIFYVSPSLFLAVNANTDPTSEWPGMATLTPGIWPWTRVIHNLSKDPKEHPHYAAFGQAADVIVSRWGSSAIGYGIHDERGFCLANGLWRGQFGIHMHRGGDNTTTSEGCQTIPPEQWNGSTGFYALVDLDLKRYGITSWPYLLTARDSA
jgi:lysozyme